MLMQSSYRILPVRYHIELTDILILDNVSLPLLGHFLPLWGHFFVARF